MAEFITSGGQPPTPAIFGEYEMGRSRKLIGGFDLSPWPRDGMPQRVTLHEQAWRRHLNAGDPGAYNPYEFEHAGKIPKGKRAAFNSTTEKKFPAKIEGLDSPVVGHYPKVCPEKTIGELDDAVRYPFEIIRHIFTSKSSQRPEERLNGVPGCQTYTPNPMSTYPKIQNSGASMRSKGDSRWTGHASYTSSNGLGPNGVCKSMTTDDLGPGCYDGANNKGSLSNRSAELLARSSRLRPGFGTTTAQRGVPPGSGYGKDTPDPGAYYPFEPRIKHRALKQFANVKAATDNDITDDPTQNDRMAAAQASRDRKAAELRARRAANREMREKIRNTKAATDNDVSDDQAGAARRKAAADSKAKKEADAAAMSKMNSDFAETLRTTGARTDNDVTDDETGAARRQAAKDSKERKAQTARQLASENKQIFTRVRNTGAATDNDVTDDETGAMRRKAAKEGQTRKAQTAREMARENAEMSSRLKATGAATDNGGKIVVQEL